MPASSSPDGPTGSASSTSPSGMAAVSRASGEIVHEQTVRAPIPVAPATETTVRMPAPTQPRQEQTVRAFVPSAIPGGSQAPEVEELEELDVEPVVEAEATASKGFDVGALVSELEARVRHASSEDVPVSRADQITAPEAVVKTSELLASPKRDPRARGRRPRAEGPPPRPEPPAVSGEVSVSEPDPGDLFGPPQPRREERVRAAAPARAPKPRRDDPPLVSGEVAIDPAAAKTPEVPAGDVRVLPMTSSGPQSMMASSGSHPILLSSGPQPMMTSSGSHPILLSPGGQAAMTSSGQHPILSAPGPQAARNSSGSHPIMTVSGGSPVVPRRSSIDPGYSGTEITGPQPPAQADTTGPHRVVAGLRRRGGESSRDSLVLWVLAGALVVLALGVVMMVISWTQ